MTCPRPDHKKRCVRMRDSVPTCGEALSDIINGSLPFPHRNDEAGLLLQFFELGKVFIEKNMVKFHAGGTCMYPCIRPDDILRIEPKRAEDIRIGDIAVYRRFSRLLSHRAVDKGKENGAPYIITRPDTAKSGNDGPSFDKDILGIVSGVERNGRVLGTEKKDYAGSKKLYLDCLLALYHMRQFLWSRVILIVTVFQQSHAYRKAAKCLYFGVNKRTDSSICVPHGDKAEHGIFRKVSIEELSDLYRNGGARAISGWLYRLNINSRQAASLSFVFKPEGCAFHGWWVLEAKTRIRFRGTGVEEKLSEDIDRLFRLLKTDRIHACEFRDRLSERLLFQNLGFKETGSYADDFLKDRYNRPLVRIMMTKSIK